MLTTDSEGNVRTNEKVAIFNTVGLVRPHEEALARNGLISNI